MSLSESDIKNIETAIGTGEVLTIVYDGGSHPGTAREIVPLNVVNNNFLWALCIKTNEKKQFKLNKITLCNAERKIDYIDQPLYTSLTDVISKNIAALQARGWHVEYTDDHIYLSLFFKNGKPRKTPIVSFTFYNDCMRPWSVRSPHGPHSFVHFDKAAIYFLSEALKNCTP